MGNLPHIRQFDASRRITIPNEVLDQAGIQSGDYVSVSWDPATLTIKLQLLEFVPRAALKNEQSAQPSATPKADAKQAEQPPKK